MRASFWLPDILEPLILNIQKNWKKYLHIDNNVYFQVCKVSIQNTMYFILHKKDKL
jgi:hypothetical protein